MVWSQEKSIFLDTGEFIERIAMNRDRTHVVTGSRSGLKVISVDSNKIELKYDLRKVRRGGMHPYLDLAWNQLKDNLLASLLNGAILLWDLNYHQSSYPDQQFRAHKQAATAIAFSEFNEYLLVSGSKEGAIFLYDVRQREPSLSFSSYGKDTIRDIQFSTESKAQDLFVTADDSGTVRFWDIRRPDRMLKEFIAHTGFVSNVSLNPHLPSQYLVATAGRDRYVRVWDWSKPSPERVYTVEMIAGVSRVAWCPDNPWHLASCFVNDRNIYVWDVRRPHLPYAMYSPHTDGVSDMCWPRYNGSVCDRFVSSSKDGRVALSFTSHASRPLNHANTVALTCASTFDGVIVTIPERKRSSSCGSAADALDLFRRSVPSTIFCVLPYEIDTNISRAHTISFLAKHYKTSGGSVERLCTRNAEVAENAAIFSTPNSNRIGPYIKASSESEYDCGCVQLAFSWRTIALLCAGTELTNSCANICADTNAISGGLFSAALIRRKDLYRQPLLGRETSLDTNNLSSSDADEFGGVKISCTSGMRGANDIVLNGKFKSNAPDAIANDSVDSGSESDESSIESSSTSTIDDDQNILSAYMNAIDTMATLRHRRSGNGSRRQRRRALAAPTTLISGSLSQIAHNSLNADFFFGVNELNLYGMSANSASYGTCGRLSLKILENNASEFNELYSNIKDSQGRKKGRESRQSCNRKQFMNYYTDISKIKDEALDFRAHRHHNSVCSEDFTATTFSMNRQNSTHSHYQFQMLQHSFISSVPHSSQNSVDIEEDDINTDLQTTENNKANILSGNEYEKNERKWKTKNDYEKNESYLKEKSHNNVNNSMAGMMMEEDKVDDIVEEVVDLIDDYVDDDGAQMSNSCSDDEGNSGDDQELSAALYNGSNGALSWDPLPHIKSILDYFSDMGDVQTCATISLILGDKLSELKLVKQIQIDHWINSYLELLERLEMWNAASALIKTCKQISHLSNVSTYVKKICIHCSTIATRASQWCQACKKSMVPRCCTCDQYVRGIWSQCTACGHGGHLEHMTEWFEEFAFCPFPGCEHICVPAPASMLNEFARGGGSTKAVVKMRATGAASRNSMPNFQHTIQPPSINNNRRLPSTNIQLSSSSQISYQFLPYFTRMKRRM